MNLNKFNIFYKMNGVESYSGVENNETKKTMADYLPSVSNQKAVEKAKKEAVVVADKLNKTGKPLDPDIQEALKVCDELEGPEINTCIQDIQLQLSKLKSKIIPESNESKDKLGPGGRKKEVQNALLQQAGLDPNVFPKKGEPFKFIEN